MIKRISLFSLISLILVTGLAFAKEEKPYPYKICSAVSPDGLKWVRDVNTCLEDARSSSAVTKDGKIYLYFVEPKHALLHRETTECAVSADGMNFEKQHLIIAGIETYAAKFPSVIIDQRGVFRLYYLADDPILNRKDKRQIHLAESVDGIYFEEKKTVFFGPGISSPKVFFFKGKWFLFVASDKKSNVLVAVSDDGYDFKYETELAFRSASRPIELADGNLRLYTFLPDPGCMIMRSFISNGALNWDLEAENRLEAFKGEKMSEVSVIEWRGGFKMFFTSAPQE